MRYWIGLTDRRWFEFLSAQAPLDEVNFWIPSGRKPVDLAGFPFLFKLHAGDGGQIVGGGFYDYFTRLPARMVWDAYGIKNGAPDFDVMASQLKRYRPGFDVDADSIGCLALTAPFFLKRDLWIDQPADWPSSAQTGKTYDSTVGSGASLWERVQVALAALATQTQPAIRETLPIGERYGAPILVAPRLGQGTFRAKVIDAYERRCAVTNERTLPVLQASHIKPYSQSGPHAPENGLLLRSDLHTLFDRGYLTVTPARTVMVSRRIKEEFENGRDYYALDGRQIRPPARGFPPPSAEYLEWHADTVFKR